MYLPYCTTYTMYAAQPRSHFQILVKMAGKEIDSFLLKFKSLLYSEKNATLTIKSEAGKADITLTVSLDHVSSDLPPPPLQYHRPSPPTPERRCARRAKEQSLAAEEAAKISATNSEEEPPSIAEVAVITAAAAFQGESPGIAEEAECDERIVVELQAEKVPKVELRVTKNVIEINNDTFDEATNSNIPQLDGLNGNKEKRISFYMDGVPPEWESTFLISPLWYPNRICYQCNECGYH